MAARRKYPGKRILVSNIDYKLAHSRCHLGAKTAIQTRTQLPDKTLAVVALRLTFVEIMRDLKTAILHEDDWSPAKTHATNSNIVLKKKIMSDEVPFGVLLTNR